MNALKLLEQDHEKVRKILEDLDATTERGVKTRETLIAKLKQELQIHEAIEEEIFYPAMRERLKDDELVLEAFEEHRAVDTLLDELEGVGFDDESWGAKLTVIEENIEHHIEEEEGPLFTQARKVFDDAELDDLGERMGERKNSVIGSR